MSIKVGIISSRFNQPVVDELLQACLDKLKEHGLESDQIFHQTVPGALEIPLALDLLALSKKYDVLIAIGAVIRGETYHFEVVSDQSAFGLIQVQLNHHIPIINGIITTNNDEAYARTKVKGEEAALVAIEMATLAKNLKNG
jgi:6,7-dimethyl-8-ribityllumazine synthase